GLGIAVLARGHVEHELRDRAVQPRDLALHDDEAAAGDFGAGREVEAAEALADVDMVENLKVEAPRLAPAPLLAVLLGAVADRHRFVRHVGNAAEEILEPGLELRELLFGPLEELLQLLALRQQLAHVLTARLRLADVLRDLVARRLRLLDRGLQVLA